MGMQTNTAIDARATTETEIRIERIYERAVGLPAAERRALLDAEALDSSVRAEIEALIEADAQAEASGFLDRDASGDTLTGRPCGAVDRPLTDRPLTDSPRTDRPLLDDPPPGGRLGAYRIVRAIGRGGMGAVYLAERADREFDKQVAVKLARPSAAGAERRRRLRAERQILAGLEHPDIARLLDGGTTPCGRPYLVMEYVQGEPIDRACDRRRLSVDARIALVARVCRAVHDAHRNLIVHRDLKPSNILVTSDGAPKLVDFGIAELLDPGREVSSATDGAATAPRLLTPDYASPEQLAGASVGVASDVYSLGVVLYELLTGRLPFEPGSRDRRLEPRDTTARPPRASERVVGLAQDEAAARGGLRPAALRRRLRGDLDHILDAALDPRPAARYASAWALADDLERHLEHRPIDLRADSWSYRLATLVRRRRWTVALGLLAIAALIVTTVELAILSTRVAEERDAARRERDAKAEVLGFVEGLLEAADPWHPSWRDASVQELLERGADDAASSTASAAVRAELFGLLGGLHASWGQHEEAERLAREGVALRRSAVDPPPTPGQTLALADSLQGLGEVLWFAGRRDEAEATLREALALRNSVLDEPDAGTASIHAALGVVLRDLGRHEEAESHGARALALRRRLLGETHPKTLESLGDRVGELHYKGRLDEAEELSLRVIELRAEHCPTGHPLLGLALHNHAFLLRNQDRYDEAEPFARRALATLRDALGDDHPDIAMARNQLGLILTRRDPPRAARFDEAESQYRAALATSEHLGGPNHPPSADSWHGLAILELRRGRLAEADTAIRRALEIIRPALPDDHPRRAALESLLEEITLRRGRVDPENRSILEAEAQPEASFSGRRPRPEPSERARPSRSEPRTRGPAAPSSGTP